jgi:cytochrome c peroxidase
MHNGQFDSLENVIEFYQETSKLARKNQLRNASPDLIGIHIEKQDVASIAAFLRALNEDYE